MNNLKNQKKIQTLNPNIYNKYDVIKWGIVNFRNYNDSVISDIFNLFEIKESKCLKCDNIAYDFHSFFTYELDILEAYKYKNNNAITLFD